MAILTPPDLISSYIERLLAREGGLADVAADRGGATRWGITRSTLSFFRKKDATLDDIKNLSREEAAAIYRLIYFTNHHLGLLPDEIEEQVFDFGVNSGPQHAISALQECLGLKADGVVGPATVAAAVLACRPDGGRALNLSLAKWRAMMLSRICRRDPSQIAFLSGWLARTLSFAR